MIVLKEASAKANSGKKYEFTGKTKKGPSGARLRQIRALIDFKPNLSVNYAVVTAGTVGGYIESEDNLSQQGTCWVAGAATLGGGIGQVAAAMVWGNAKVYEDAYINCGCKIYDQAKVHGQVEVDYSTELCGTVDLGGDFGVQPDSYADEGVIRNQREWDMADEDSDRYDEHGNYK